MINDNVARVKFPWKGSGIYELLAIGRGVTELLQISTPTIYKL